MILSDLCNANKKILDKLYRVIGTLRDCCIKLAFQLVLWFNALPTIILPTGYLI